MLTMQKQPFRGLYKGSDNPIDTFGVYATLVSSADVDADRVYTVVKAVFDNFERFKRYILHLRI